MFCGYCAPLSKGHVPYIQSTDVWQVQRIRSTACIQSNFTAGSAVSVCWSLWTQTHTCTVYLSQNIQLPHLQSWSCPQFQRPNALSDQFCQHFAFPKCTKEMASALCSSHLCSSFVLAGSFLGGKSSFLTVLVCVGKSHVKKETYPWLASVKLLWNACGTESCLCFANNRSWWKLSLPFCLYPDFPLWYLLKYSQLLEINLIGSPQAWEACGLSICPLAASFFPLQLRGICKLSLVFMLSSLEADFCIHSGINK